MPNGVRAATVSGDSAGVDGANRILAMVFQSKAVQQRSLKHHEDLLGRRVQRSDRGDVEELAEEPRRPLHLVRLNSECAGEQVAEIDASQIDPAAGARE